MTRKHPSKAWTGKVPPDQYYRDWLTRLLDGSPLAFYGGIAAILIGCLYAWVTHA